MSTIATIKSGSVMRSARDYCLPSLLAAVAPSWLFVMDQSGEFPLSVKLTFGPDNTD